MREKYFAFSGITKTSNDDYDENNIEMFVLNREYFF